MFKGTAAKLEDAQAALRQLKAATDAQAARLAFTSFIAHARAVTNALQKEAAAIDGFPERYTQKQAEMKADALMRFVHEARIEDFHQATSRITFRIDVECIESFEVNIPDDEVCQSYHCEYDNQQGAFVVLDPGTPRERRLPTIVKGKFGPLQAMIVDAPTAHLGQPINASDPIQLCTLALQCLEHLTFDAKVGFAAVAPKGRRK